MGDRIKKRRKELGLTQPALGKAVGVSRAAVSLWEKNENEPKGINLQSIARALRCSADWLIDGRSEKSVSEAPANYNAGTPSAIPILDKKNVLPYLQDENVEVVSVSAELSVIAKMLGASDKCLAFEEDSPGMAPRILPGEVLIIDPGAEKRESGDWLVSVDGELVIGSVGKTPRGLVLSFYNQSPGWEPISIQTDDMLAKVVATIPKN